MSNFAKPFLSFTPFCFSLFTFLLSFHIIYVFHYLRKRLPIIYACFYFFIVSFLIKCANNLPVTQLGHQQKHPVAPLLTSQGYLFTGHHVVNSLRCNVTHLTLEAVSTSLCTETNNALKCCVTEFNLHSDRWRLEKRPLVIKLLKC